MQEGSIENSGQSSGPRRAGELLLKTHPKAKAKMVAAKVAGELVDLTRELAGEAEPEPVLDDSGEGLEILRHTASHIMAQAVQELYPGTKLAIGPAVADGFYYDFDSEETFTPEHMEAIEARMAEIVKANLPLKRLEMSLDEAKEFFEKRGEGYKLELLDDIEEGTVTVYFQDDFYDLCRGPHLTSTGRLKAFKLLKLAGAYWRGDERNKMLQRVYGTAFPDRKGLKKYLNFLKEAEKRDHRKLGKELDLFSFHDEVGAGMVIWHPGGAMLRYLIEEFERREHLKRGYVMAQGPTLLKTSLWQKSGHFDNYRENMYFSEIEGSSYGVKPMNCLAHMLIYKSQVRSYRDLPLRYFELGTVHRHERSGVLHGLIRVRQFTQDDAHILCTPEQLDSEIKGILDFVVEVMEIFGFDFELEISTRPDKSIGTDEDWERATSALMKALDDRRDEYRINEGDGAFYGPKIDVKLKDAIGRSWQCATIQCDFTLPERFDLTYVGPDNQPHRPVMIHRVILGSLERFIAVLIEHYSGRLPTWLAPVQAVVLTITDEQMEYAAEVAARLRAAGVRVQEDFRNEKLGYKIREAQLKKIPYMLVVGKNEVKERGVAPRRRDGKDLGLMPLEDAVELLRAEGAFPETG